MAVINDQARGSEEHIMTVLVGTLVGALGVLIMRPIVRHFAVDNSPSWVSVPVAALSATAMTIGVDGLLVATALGSLSATLVVLSDIDMRVRRLPREISYPAAVLGAVLLTTDAFVRNRADRVVMVLAGAAAFTAVMLALHVLGRGALGDGDVRVAPLLGSFLGYWSPGLVLVALFVASLSAAIVGVGLMVFRRTGRATTVAFGPFLAVGTVAAIVLGG